MAGTGTASLATAVTAGTAVLATVWIALTVFFGVVSSCFTSLAVDSEFCELRTVVVNTTAVAVATLGLGVVAGAVGRIAEPIIDFFFDALPPFATDYLGSREPSS